MLGSSCLEAPPRSTKSEVGGDRSWFLWIDCGHESLGDCNLWLLEGSHGLFENATQLPTPA